MLTYLSAALSGEVDPFWPHVILVSASVVGGVAVAVGIILESPKYSAATHLVAMWLVICGVAVESISSVCLFVFDEGISSHEQSQIVALTRQLIISDLHATARRLTAGSPQSRAVSQAMQSFSGMPVKVISYEDDHEARTFTIELMRALRNVLLDTPYRFERVTVDEIGATENGVVIASGPDLRSMAAARVLMDKLEELQFCVSPPHQLDASFFHVDSGTLLVFVGYKNTLANCK